MTRLRGALKAAEARAEEAEARADKAEARADKAEARADKAEARVDKAKASKAELRERLVGCTLCPIRYNTSPRDCKHAPLCAHHHSART
jgi:chromosome segregation ATPase